MRAVIVGEQQAQFFALRTAVCTRLGSSRQTLIHWWELGLGFPDRIVTL